MLLLWSFHKEDFKHPCCGTLWSDALGIPGGEHNSNKKKRMFPSLLQHKHVKILLVLKCASFLSLGRIPSNLGYTATLPGVHFPNEKPVMCSADISSVIVGQPNMSPALDVSFLSFVSIVDASNAVLSKAGVGRMGKGSQMFALPH